MTVQMDTVHFFMRWILPQPGHLDSCMLPWVQQTLPVPQLEVCKGAHGTRAPGCRVTPPHFFSPETRPVWPQDRRGFSGRGWAAAEAWHPGTWGPSGSDGAAVGFS